MSMRYIKVSAIRKNQVTFKDGPHTMQIDCDANQVKRIEYLIPVITNGVLTGYENRIITDPTDAPTDALRTVRFEDTVHKDVVWALASPAWDDSYFVDGCNQCCDGVTDYTYPQGFVLPIMENSLCYAVGTTGSYSVPLPANHIGLTFTVSPDSTYNKGQAIPGTYSASGYTAANLVAALNTQASALGTWSLSGTKIVLATTTVRSLNFNAIVVNLKKCLTVTTPGTAETMRWLRVLDDAGNPIDIAIGPVAFSIPAIQQLGNQIRNAVKGTVTVNTTSNKIQYEGQQTLVSVLSADKTTNVHAFASGACT